MEKIYIILIVLLCLGFIDYFIKERKVGAAFISVVIMIIGALLGYYLPKILESEGTGTTISTSFESTATGEIDEGDNSGEGIDKGTDSSRLTETSVQPYDLLSTDPVIGTESEIGSGFWNNSATSYHDAGDQGGYLYYIFGTGKNSDGYDEESMSITYAIPEGYTKLSFSVGVHPKGSTNVGTVWIELHDVNGNLIPVTNQNGGITSTTKHMTYDDTAESYTSDISDVSRLQ